MLGNFCWFCCRLLTFLKINFFFFLQKFFQEHVQSDKGYGSRSGPTEHALSILHALWFLISVQTVCKGYQQTTKNANSKERIRLELGLDTKKTGFTACKGSYLPKNPHIFMLISAFCCSLLENLNLQHTHFQYSSLYSLCRWADLSLPWWNMQKYGCRSEFRSNVRPHW